MYSSNTPKLECRYFKIIFFSNKFSNDFLNQLRNNYKNLFLCQIRFSSLRNENIYKLYLRQRKTFLLSSWEAFSSYSVGFVKHLMGI